MGISRTIFAYFCPFQISIDLSVDVLEIRTRGLRMIGTGESMEAVLFVL